jgi:hypothetical protein
VKRAKRAVPVLTRSVDGAEVHDLVVTLHFAFKRPVSERQLAAAILRSVRTKEFGITGQCTVVTILSSKAAVQGPCPP